jgi:hypothetical protein
MRKSLTTKERHAMHFQLKSISPESIPEALAKIERYRLLNEPALAESICLDILAILPDHQPALISLLLARTDQFRDSLNAKAAQDILAEIKGEYERAYYTGIIWERLAHARMHQRNPGVPAAYHALPGASAAAYHALRTAMSHFEKAATLSPAGNDDATLRWNTCARTIMQHPEIIADEQAADTWQHSETSSRIADA